ncbi:hypothetical protein MALU111345_15610 [Marinicrinis lubricantis]
MEDADNYLTNLIVNDKDLSDMEYMVSEQERTLAKVRLDNKLESEMTTFKSIDAVFVYTIRSISMKCSFVM